MAMCVLCYFFSDLQKVCALQALFKILLGALSFAQVQQPFSGSYSDTFQF